MAAPSSRSVAAIAKASGVPPGTAKVVVVGGRPVALFNVGGTFYATDGVCLHRGGPVGEGTLEGPTVTCPWHGWEYDVRTGQNVGNPAAKLRTYRVVVEGDDVTILP